MFTSLSTASPADWAVIRREEDHYDAATSLLALLSSLRPLPKHGYPINVYDHSLQTASRALRDGAPEDVVVAALFHDAADELAPHHHGPVAAQLLSPWLSADLQWLLHHHSVFQTLLVGGADGADIAAVQEHVDRLSTHPAAAATLDFCRRWDEPSFDPDYRSLPLSEFEPIVRRVVTRHPGTAATAP